MVELITVMIGIILTWGLVGAAVAGIGALFAAAFRRTPSTPTGWLLAWWAGLAILTAYLQVWHFVFAVTPAALYGVYAVGFVGLVWHGRGLPALLWQGVRRYPLLALVFVFIVLFAANNALLEPKRYDTGLYQIQSVMWTNTYPIVPGLGNLHGRLAFNNSYHLIIALLNHAQPISGRGLHLANGLPLLSLTAWGLLGIGRFVIGGRRDAITLYWALTFPVVIRHTLHISLYSPDNDLMALLVGLVALGLVLDVLTQPNSSGAGYRLSVLALLVGMGVTFKLSFAALGAGLALVGLWALWRSVGWGGITLAGLVGLGLVVPWMGRSVMMSGYPLYPSTFSPFPVDWLMVEEMLTQEAEWVRAWARQPGVTGFEGTYWDPQIVGWDWLIPWLFDTFTTTPNLFDVTLPVGLAVGALMVKLWRRGAWGRGWLILLPIGAALVFWWMVAPSPRFAGAAFWGMAAACLALVGAEVAREQTTAINGGALAVALVAVLLLPVQLRVVFPAGESVFYDVPEPVIREHISTFTTFNEPLETDQCWGAPLPCAPGYAQVWDLCQRDPDHLWAGFAVLDGRYSRCDEQPRNPNPTIERDG